MPKHRPTQSELTELSRAWAAFQADEVDFPRLGDAIQAVLGRPMSDARKALLSAKEVGLIELVRQNDEARRSGASYRLCRRCHLYQTADPEQVCEKCRKEGYVA